MREHRTQPKIMHTAGELRKEMTPAERMLWEFLRDEQLMDVKFRRQHAIGRYIVDFCSPQKKLIIELDGGSHLSQKDQDAERTAILESGGYRLLRFWNTQVMNDIKGVLDQISTALTEER